MASTPWDAQLNLFDVGQPAAPPTRLAELDPLADRLPAHVHLGTSSWTFPGWAGLVYPGQPSQTELARRGLRAYAAHRLLRTVCIDRTFYGPLEPDAFAGYARDVPVDFRFVAKAHEWLTMAHFPLHPRYGAQRGSPSPYFLDASYASDAVVGPLVQGLGERAGPLVFQFPPQDVASLGGPERLLQRLYRFLDALPKGPLYAVEFRNEELFSDRFAAMLKAVDAVPVLTVWGTLPGVLAQAERTHALERRALVVRWNLRRGLAYEEARERYMPFDRLVDEDAETRAAIAVLVDAMARQGRPAFVTANNKAEGSAPWTVVKLAERIARLPSTP